MIYSMKSGNCIWGCIQEGRKEGRMGGGRVGGREGRKGWREGGREEILLPEPASMSEADEVVNVIAYWAANQSKPS
jgi:hypothetical protein